MSDAVLVYLVLSATLFLFIVGVFRYDIVALLALLVLVFTGIVSHEDAFTGFSNPAVITVAAVLVISRALELSGITEVIGRVIANCGPSQTVQVGVLAGVVGIFSAFINNVGALALMLPLGIELAKRHGRSPSFVLMPMAFASLLGGMTTLIGTPPNLIVANFRQQANSAPFTMFDFSYVGVGVFIVGLVYLALIGWRFIPHRAGTASESLFEIENYISDLVVLVDSKLLNTQLGCIAANDDDITVLALRLF